MCFIILLLVFAMLCCLPQHAMDYKFVSSIDCLQFQTSLHVLLMLMIYFFHALLLISLHCGSPEGELSEYLNLKQTCMSFRYRALSLPYFVAYYNALSITRG